MITLSIQRPTYPSGVYKDGNEIELLPLSKKHYTEMLAMRKDLQDCQPEELVKRIYQMLNIILSCNADNIKLTQDEIESISPIMAGCIIKNYTQYMKNAISDPN